MITSAGIEYSVQTSTIVPETRHVSARGALYSTGMVGKTTRFGSRFGIHLGCLNHLIPLAAPKECELRASARSRRVKDLPVWLPVLVRNLTIAELCDVPRIEREVDALYTSASALEPA